MVSISVHGLCHENENRDKGDENKAKLGESAVWYPDRPDPALRFLGVRDERLSKRLDNVPNQMCLFGGRDGQLLPYLTHVEVTIIDRSILGTSTDYTAIWGNYYYLTDSD